MLLRSYVIGQRSTSIDPNGLGILVFNIFCQMTSTKAASTQITHVNLVTLHGE